MSKPFVCALVATVLAGAGATMPAGQQRPGEMTRGEVWIQNRGKTEAVPVMIEEVATVQVIGTPAVQVSGTPTVTISPSSVAQARLVRQVWDYHTVKVATGQDAASALSRPGNEGWEATGNQFSDGFGTTILMKRPRQ
jgi:hypothetical protein